MKLKVPILLGHHTCTHTEVWILALVSSVKELLLTVDLICAHILFRHFLQMFSIHSQTGLQMVMIEHHFTSSKSNLSPHTKTFI